MGTTSNYSWPYPESTDPVADGAADIQALADAADTTGRAIELATVQRFADASARNTALSGIEVEGMFAFLQDTDVLTYWDGSAWVEFSTGVKYGAATGGSSSTITVGGESYTLLTFTASGTLTVTTPGVFDVLVVGGGGGGGTAGSLICGAGGAGGYREFEKIYFDTNQTVVVGAGDAVNGYRGTGSRCGQPFVGGGGTTYLYLQGRNGASGGGGGYSTAIGGKSDDASGNNGGGGGAGAGGGGGGAGAVGSNGGSNIGGDGGDGLDASAFRGESAGTTYYAGGGGGEGATTRGLGGLGGGGNGKDPSNASTAGAANTGGGGGGDGSAGGSGIVLVRFKN